MVENSATADYPAWLHARATAWLGRPLRPGDGVPAERLDAAGERLGVPLPPALTTTYALVGAVAALMRGHEEFAPPEDWEVHDGRLMFLMEQQRACAWGVDADGQVWMQSGEEFDPEGGSLEEFFHMLLPFQLAMGGWPHTAAHTVEADVVAARVAALAATLGWPQLVDHNGLLIYGAAASMVWTLGRWPDRATADLCVTSRDRAEFDRLVAELGLAD